MPILSTGIGIDISDHHVRIAWLGRRGGLKGLYELELEHGLIEDDQVIKKDKMSAQIIALIGKTEIVDEKEPTTILIPESRVFSKALSFPRTKDEESLILQAKTRAQQEIPIPFSIADVQIEYAKKNKETSDLTIFAVQKEIIENIKNAFSLTTFELVAMEVNNQAVYRLFNVYGSEDSRQGSDLLMIIDIGHRWTNLSLFDIMGRQVFSRSVHVRSNASKGRAEKLATSDIGKICVGINETIAFYKTQDVKIALGLIAGVEGEQVEVGKQCQKDVKDCPIRRVSEMVQIPGAKASEVHIYGAAIGAALRSIKLSKHKKVHNFLYE